MKKRTSAIRLKTDHVIYNAKVDIFIVTNFNPLVKALKFLTKRKSNGYVYLGVL